MAAKRSTALLVLYAVAAALWVVPGHAEPGSAPAAVRSYDVVVYCATPAGIAAATSARRASSSGSALRVALVEPSKLIGGMATAGGIGLRDGGILSAINGTARAWAMLNAQHYNETTPVWQPDEVVGTASFWTLLNKYGVDVIVDQEIVSATVSGTRVASISTASCSSSGSGETEWMASVFIDASYDGDLMVAAGVSHTWGREPREQYGESLAGVQPYTSWQQFNASRPVNPVLSDGSLMPFVGMGPVAAPGSADRLVMGYSYRACLTTLAELKTPFPKPPGYNRSDFALVQAYIESLGGDNGRFPTGPPFGFMVDILPYRSGPAHMYDMCDSAAGITSDAVQLSSGYPNASRSEKAAMAVNIKNYVQGLVYYLANDPAVPEFTRSDVNKYGLCNNAWPDNGNFPPLLYVREGMRMVGDVVTTQNDLKVGVCTSNSIGLGTWPIDIHVVQRLAVDTPPPTRARGTEQEMYAMNEGEMMTALPGTVPGGVLAADVDMVAEPRFTWSMPKPFEMPVTLLMPKRAEVTNVMVPVCHSSSHVAYGANRVEPQFMVLGQAAGVVAALALHGTTVDVQDVPIADVQRELVKQGVILHWPASDCA